MWRVLFVGLVLLWMGAGAALAQDTPTDTPTPTPTDTLTITPTPSDTPTPTPDLYVVWTLPAPDEGPGQAVAFHYLINEGDTVSSILLLALLTVHISGLFLRLYKGKE